MKTNLFRLGMIGLAIALSGCPGGGGESVDYLVELKVQGTGSGVVTTDPADVITCTPADGTCSSEVSDGTVLTLIAQPATGSVFKEWIGAECNATVLAANPLRCQVEVTTDLFVMAVFDQEAQKPVAIEVNVNTDHPTAGGTVTLSHNLGSCQTACNFNLDDAAPLTFVALANPGSGFVSWSGACAGTNGPICMVTPNGGDTVTVDALFKLTECMAGTYDLNGDLGQPGSDGCEYACTFTSTADLPDANYQDANCDGIDGTIGAAIFVDAIHGSNGNDGSKDAPVASIQAGYAQAQLQGKTQLYISEGNYPGPITLVNGISLYGSFNSALGWSRGPSHISVIAHGGTPGEINSIALKGMGINVATTVAGMKISASASGTAAPGASAIGVLCSECHGLNLRNNVIEATGASDGVAGIAGGNGLNGNPGVEGVSSTSCLDTQNDGGTGGSLYVAGGTGGNGRASASTSQTLSPGAAGSASGSVVGGAGGTTSGAPGQNGNTGLMGSHGLGGGRDGNLGSLMTSGPDLVWIGSSGADGSAGLDGSGGGGGASGDGIRQMVFGTCGLCVAGGGGGGGGGGGQAGQGGTAGTAGGSNFGVLLNNSGAATLQNNTITTAPAGKGGSGGMGGMGGMGGVGGAGGTGAPASCGASTDTGGVGGKGGVGGMGGQGGGGTGGNSVGIYFIGGTPASNVSGNVIQVGAGGMGGPGGGANGSGAQGLSAPIVP